ncbi:MAG: dimethylarginine dimethylaminohydrolase family protein [Pseudonocardiaceae bacterium]
MERVMCPPTYFDIEYSINPWMDVNDKVDHDLAMTQWTDLVELLESLGDTISIVEAQPGLPDMTFAGDAGLLWGRRFVPSTFRHVERAGEVVHFERWFRQHGYEICPLPTDVIFEGLGDLVFHNRRAFVGHGYRSDERAVDHLARLIPGLEIVGRLETVDDHYFHLAMAMGFIDDATVVYYEPAFTVESVQTIRRVIPRAISVSAEDANSYFACNNLVIDDKVLVDMCTPELRAALGECGYDVISCPMSEFKKSGGSLRCLALTAMGEEAPDARPRHQQRLP